MRPFDLPLFPRLRSLAIIIALFLKLPQPASAAAETLEETEGGLVIMEAYSVYGGDIPVIDGFTGNKYHGANSIAWDFAKSFNKILLAYHKRLLDHEIKHMKFRLEVGNASKQELKTLAHSFGIKNLSIDNSQWMRRERSILHRLNTKPFFKINKLIVWDLDQLNTPGSPTPNSKYAKDIRYNAERSRWERRVTTEWKVNHVNPRNHSFISILKQQGLNLDTNEGYHIINRGLPPDVHPDAFEDVNLTYPIFVSSDEDTELQLKRLQKTYLKNLYYIYDPFSWVARRNTRFRGGFYKEALEGVKAQRFKLDDRNWFDPVFASLLNDIVTIRQLGAKEIYSLYTYEHFKLAKNGLGDRIDLLNWHEKEQRTGAGSRPNAPARINFNKPDGARFILVDAYLRYGDAFVDQLRANLSDITTKTSGMELVKGTIATVSGTSFEQYLASAAKTQLEQIEKFR